MFLRSLLRKLFAARESKDVEMVKPFLDHLEDLRWTLVKMVATLSLGMVLSFGFRAQLIRVVEAPLLAVNGHGNVHLQALGPADSMNVSLTLAFYAGIVLTFPLQLYFLAGFVLPALSQKEKAYVLPIIGATFALFLGGVFFCFLYILPLTLRWLFYDAQHMGFDPGWTVTTYFSFATQFVLIFGIVLRVAGGGRVAGEDRHVSSATTLRGTRAYAHDRHPGVGHAHRAVARSNYDDGRRRADAAALRRQHLGRLVDGAATNAVASPRPVPRLPGDGE